MREIKFRGWDGGKMIYYNHWFTLHRQSVLCFEEGKAHDYVDESDVDYPSRVTLTQYIGLEDAKGKEVFDGDVLQAQIDNACLWEVVWNFNGWFLKRWVNGVVDDGFYGYRDDLVCVGNIYENPKLLK